MISVNEAFFKFRNRLETTDTEDKSASFRQQQIRRQLDAALDIADDFLTGAYRRHTKTKPLRDVDIMIVLKDTVYLDQHPHEVLELVRGVLAPYYGEQRVCCDRRAVRVDFGVDVVEDLSDEVVSFDVVPAFAHLDHYLIPDDVIGGWVHTNPKIHADKATAANKNFAEQWKPLVKMIKKWNEVTGHPIEPSFLNEVMALKLITGGWTGDHARELKQFSPARLTASMRVGQTQLAWARMFPMSSTPASRRQPSRKELQAAEAACTEAINLERAGRIVDALAAWRTIFGPLFPLS
jgi:hypothetical protein